MYDNCEHLVTTKENLLQEHTLGLIWKLLRPR